MSTGNLVNKKVIIVAVLAIGAVSAILVASSLAQTTAQQEQQKMRLWSNEGIPEINGSVSIVNETIDFINENVRVSFAAAAETAQSQVPDGRVFGGYLGVVQGYLVYKFFVVNTANQTGYLVIVDAGNGEVLHTSEGRPLGSFSHSMYGEGWHGRWKGQG